MTSDDGMDRTETSHPIGCQCGMCADPWSTPGATIAADRRMRAAEAVVIEAAITWRRYTVLTAAPLVDAVDALLALRQKAKEQGK